MLIQKINIDEKIKPSIKKQINSYQVNKEYSSIWQTIEWNEMLEKSWLIEKWYILIDENNWNINNYLIIEKRYIGAKNYWLFAIWVNQELNEKFEKKLLELCKEEKCLFIQIEPLIEQKLEFFKIWNFKKFIEKCSATIDLKLDEEEILTNMKPKWRYNIKLAQKSWIEIKKAINTKENLDIFYQLLEETNCRDNFAINSYTYYKELLDFIYKENIWWLYFAYKNNEIIAWWVWVMFGWVSIYYYWASSSKQEYRKLMPTYLLQWELIKESITKWCKIYDFLWIMCENSKDKHLLWVTDFKLKLTNNTIVWPEAYIYINKKILYFSIKFIKFIKNLIK